jgi:hypothetical protein
MAPAGCCWPVIRIGGCATSTSAPDGPRWSMRSLCTPWGSGILPRESGFASSKIPCTPRGLGRSIKPCHLSKPVIALRSLHGTIHRNKAVGAIGPKSSWRRCRTNVSIAALPIKRRWPTQPVLGNSNAIRRVKQSSGVLRRWMHAASSKGSTLH